MTGPYKNCSFDLVCESMDLFYEKVILILKDTNRAKTPSIETPTISKSKDMDIWMIDRSRFNSI